MAIIRYLFLSMTIRFFKAARNPATRLSYALPGPVVFIGGIASILTRQHPALSLSLIIAGSAAMRIQSSMIEKQSSKSFRNAAIILALVAAGFAALGELPWAALPAVFSVALFALQKHHDGNIKTIDYRSQVARAQAIQSQQLDT